jgi:hypothetical protein
VQSCLEKQVVDRLRRRQQQAVATVLRGTLDAFTPIAAVLIAADEAIDEHEMLRAQILGEQRGVNVRPIMLLVVIRERAGLRRVQRVAPEVDAEGRAEEIAVQRY